MWSQQYIPGTHALRPNIRVMLTDELESFSRGRRYHDISQANAFFNRSTFSLPGCYLSFRENQIPDESYPGTSAKCIS